MSRRAGVLTGFAAIYLIWGSTYLAIGKTVEDVPPVFLVAVRGLLAGGVLYAWVRWRGALAVTWREVVAMLPTAILLFGGGYVLVAWAEQEVPSGAAALLNATTPAWVVLFEWLTRKRPRPALRFAVAVGLGLGGVALLVGGGPQASVPVLPALGLVIASIAWAAGTMRARAAAHGDPLRAASVQLLAGGLLLLPISLMLGEGSDIARGFTTSSLFALGYLIVFGSLVGYSAYVWLLHNVSAAKVSSHAYVNPLFAVLLGSALANERIYASTIAAAVLILVSVFFIVGERATASRPRESVRPSPRPRIAA
ncbi:MAG TPA: EamA family transporter [Longimicrobiales bacterium]|nr:EamA family transporter [Longimicrobiales bacterium]